MAAAGTLDVIGIDYDEAIITLRERHGAFERAHPRALRDAWLRLVHGVAPMPNACCQTCVWWDTDARRVTISAPCRITHAIQRPADTCDQHASHRGPHALDPVLWRIA